MLKRLRQEYVRRYLLVLLLSLALSACQSPNYANAEIQLSNGLIQTSDFANSWKWLDKTPMILIEPSTSRYDKVPTLETVNGYLTGYYGPKESLVQIFHELRRYDNAAPQLGKLHLLGSENSDERRFEPKVDSFGQSMQSECLAMHTDSRLKPVTACTVEVRYTHILSIVDVYILGEVTDNELEDVLDQVLLQANERIKAIDLQFGAKSI